MSLYISNCRRYDVISELTLPRDERSKLYEMCCQKNEGFLSYPYEMTSKSHFDFIQLEDIIILSPDADQSLEKVEIGKVYVIGAILDERKNNPLTLNQAKEKRAQVKKLPIKGTRDETLFE